MTAEFDRRAGAALRAQRNLAGLSQEALAEQMTRRGARVSGDAVSKIERGVRTLSLQEGLAAAAVLGVDPAGLAGTTVQVTVSRSTTWSVEQLAARVRVLQSELEAIAVQPALDVDDRVAV